MKLIARDPFRGSLMQSLIARRGLDGSLEFCGMFFQADAPRTQGMGSACEAAGSLAGIITMGADGRSTVLGGGPEWAPLVAGFVRERVTGGLDLAFIDTPEEMAEALATELPPQATEDLGIWICKIPAAWREVAASKPEAGRLLVREVAPSDAAALADLYATSESFRGADVLEILESWRAGLRPMLVGCLERQLVCTAFALVTDRFLARVGGVVTHPDYAGRGFATRVVGQLTGHLQELGRTPFLYVSKGNAPAVRLYRRLGYMHHATVIKLRYGSRQY